MRSYEKDMVRAVKDRLYMIDKQLTISCLDDQ